jgi:hypothetical protein
MKRLRKWTEESVGKIAKKYKTKKEWKNNDPNSYQWAYRRNLLDKLTKHMTSKKIPWTKEMVLKIALKYSSPREWELGPDRQSYPVSVRNKWHKEATAHMKRNWMRKWSKEAVLKNAIKYKTISEWIENSVGAYGAARRMGILDKACSHMITPAVTSRSERGILDIVKLKYKNARTLRVRKISIPNKPHIKGFDIDIFIPELNKGIEFDGDYHHSVDGLKRARPNWPDEDIRNYHKIKDNFFKQQYNIKILHIKEKDWLKDKDKCLKRLWKFLSK